MTRGKPKACLNIVHDRRADFGFKEMSERDQAIFYFISLVIEYILNKFLFTGGRGLRRLPQGAFGESRRNYQLAFDNRKRCRSSVTT